MKLSKKFKGTILETCFFIEAKCRLQPGNLVFVKKCVTMVNLDSPRYSISACCRTVIRHPMLCLFSIVISTVPRFQLCKILQLLNINYLFSLFHVALYLLWLEWKVRFLLVTLSHYSSSTECSNCPHKSVRHFCWWNKVSNVFSSCILLSYFLDLAVL